MVTMQRGCGCAPHFILGLVAGRALGPHLSPLCPQGCDGFSPHSCMGLQGPLGWRSNRWLGHPSVKAPLSGAPRVGYCRSSSPRAKQPSS